MAGSAADDSVRSELTELGQWFHNLHLPGGIETAPQHPLGDFPRRKWKRIHHCLPPDLTGWSVLDVGCNGGYYSFALAERGADVLGVDIDPRYLAQARWASSRLELDKLPVFRQLSVYELYGDAAICPCWVAQARLHRAKPRRRSHQLVGSKRFLRRSHASQQRLRSTGASGT